MKKICTLLLAAGAFTIASAQSRGFDHGKQESVYAYNGKQSVIHDINRTYDYKIAAIRQNRWMNRWEKSKQISQLERQRDAEIAQVQFRFEKDNHGFGNHGYADNKKHRW